MMSEVALQQARERRLLIDRFDAWIFNAINSYIGHRVLEIGCGVGNLTGHLADRELVVGVDISQESVDAVNQRFASHAHVRALVCDAADPAILDLKPNQFDTIVSLNVLEHVEDDRLVLRRCHELLVPGGRIVLIVPAHNWLYGTMDTSIGHWRRYTLRGLARRLREAGFTLLKQRYMNPVGAFGWFVNGRILRRQVAPVAQLKLFNHLVPVITAVDGMLDWPFGLSVLAIAERPLLS